MGCLFDVLVHCGLGILNGRGPFGTWLRVLFCEGNMESCWSDENSSLGAEKQPKCEEEGPIRKGCC